MAITRYSYRNPWRELETFSNRLSRIFDEDLPRTSGNAGSTSDWLPAVNVEETAEELVLTAELPGMNENDIDIELENNVLTIRGEKSTTRTEGEDRRYHLWERSYGSFQRSFTLPRTVQPEEITADFEHGVLVVHMPKAAEAKGRRIQIGGGSSQEV